MKRHLAYLEMLLTHKWHVFWACLEMKVPLWIAIIHDWSKFLPVEWVGYVYNFYNADGAKIVSQKDGYNPKEQQDIFQLSWMHHQKNNKHHWHAWCSIGEDSSITPLDMPEVYIREMIADWIGAGKTYSTSDPNKWYKENKHKMHFSAKTTEKLECLLYYYCRRQ